jgi:hypothetical protein
MEFYMRYQKHEGKIDIFNTRVAKAATFLFDFRMQLQQNVREIQPRSVACWMPNDQIDRNDP